MPSIYPDFVDAARKLSKNCSVIIPARWMKGACDTNTAKWGKKILANEHCIVREKWDDSNEVFDNVNIKGGVCILEIDDSKDFSSEKTDYVLPELKSIDDKIWKKASEKFDAKVIGGYPCCQSDDGKIKVRNGAFTNNPEILEKSDGDVLPSDYYGIFGITKGNKHCYRVFKKSLLKKNKYSNTVLGKYKVFITEAGSDGSATGIILSKPRERIGGPDEFATDSYLSIIANTVEEAGNIQKYLKTKFLRVLVSIKKATQHGSRRVYEHVPDQDFTNSSDIDWSKSIAEIDQQLYKKYGFSDEEIAFIEKRIIAYK